MTLLDRLRSRPRWQHPDAAVRAEAVRQIPAQEQALLCEIARDDADPRVRRAALRKLSDPRALAERLAAEVDVEAREQGAEALQAWAAGEDEAAAKVALAALGDPRRLALLARSARIAAVRRGALARIEDPRLLLTLAKAADDPSVRSQALARLQDEALVAEVAAKTEHRDVAMAAVDRIDDTQALDRIAAHARQKAASRRARARLDLLRPQPPAEDAPTATGQRAAASALSEIGVEPAAGVNPAPTLDSAAAAPSPAGDSFPVEPASAGLEAAPSSVADPSDDKPATDPEQARGAEVQAREARERERRRAEALCERLAALGVKKGLTLREAEAALREARALPAEAPGVVGKLIPRLKAARAALFARAQELRDADDWSRWGNAALQEELCKKLETFAARADFERMARELREADARWAQFREAPKDQAETLRQRYQAARAQVKARLNAYFARKAEEEARHLEQKQALCARAEALAGSSDWLKASEEIKALQASWKEIGPVPHRRSGATWQRFRAACDRFFSRRHEDLLRRKSEWAGNLLRKEELCAHAEALAQSIEWDASAAELKRLQAEWKSVGPVRRNKAEGVWQRFRAACDAFFERYKNRDALALAAKRAEREALCLELEALAASEAQEGLLQRTQALQARWRQAPRLGKDDELSLEKRFSEGRTRLLEIHAGAFRGSELDPDVVHARKEKLIERLEALLASSPGAETLSGEDLARRLMEALAGNTIGGAARSEAQRKAELEEAEAARSAWSKLPALAGEAGEALEQRFRDACARFFGERAPKALARSGSVSPRARPARTSRASRTQ